MKAVRLTAIALLAIVLAAGGYALFRITHTGADDYMQDSYYANVLTKSLIVGLAIPVASFILIIGASFAPGGFGARGLALALGGAAAMSGYILLANLTRSYGLAGMPRRYTEAVDAAIALNQGITMFWWLMPLGLLCVVIGGAWWGIAQRRQRA